MTGRMMGEGWKMEPPSSLAKPLIQDSSRRCAFYAWRKISLVMSRRPGRERVPPIIIPPPASYFSLEEPAQFSSLAFALQCVLPPAYLKDDKSESLH
eukprot:scaffold55555_cov73-Cyclotella_meneghiniana.AAC.3